MSSSFDRVFMHAGQQKSLCVRTEIVSVPSNTLGCHQGVAGIDEDSFGIVFSTPRAGVIFRLLT
jgi:hypothetical protein